MLHHDLLLLFTYVTFDVESFIKVQERALSCSFN